MKESPRKNIRSVLAVVLAAVALVVLGCGTSATATPSSRTASEPTQAPKTEATTSSRVEETTLRVGLHAFNQPTDPAKGGFEPMWTGIAETLFKLGRDLKPEPWLATGARQLDEKIWEVSLRQGVKFHNGALMDAAAVKASLERATVKSPTAKVLLDLARIEVKDPSTLIITTNGPSPILPALLSEPSTAVVDAVAAEAMGDAFAERAVLTGPFKVERFQQDKELVVSRHREYWGPSPLVDRVVFIYIPDNNSRVLALQSGDIDISTFIAPESVTIVGGASNLRVATTAPLSLNFMYLNHRKEAWKDTRVRQAIASAIDREALAKAVMQGQGTAATGPLPPAMLSCNQLRGYPFDPAKARQLLGQAGYQDGDGDGYVEKDGQTLTMTLLTYRQRPELPPMAEAIQGSLKTVGIKVDIRLVEQINAALAQADWDGGMYSNNMAATGDPYASLSRFFNTGGSANRGGYSNPNLDELTRQLGHARDRQERERFACTASQIVVDEVAVMPLVYPVINYGVSRKVVGLDDPHPVQFYLMDNKIGKQ